MTEVTELDVTDFVLGFWKSKPESLDPDDVLGSLGIDGDDVDDFLRAFQNRFAVNLDEFLWYFHHGEEGQNFAGLLFPPPNARVKRIPLSIRDLTASAKAGRWTIEYPAHTLPKQRYDLMINQGCAVVAVALLLAYCASKIL